MVLRLFYHHILQQYVGIYSVLFSYCSPIVLLLFSYCSPIILLSFSYWETENDTETIRKQYGIERKTNE